MWIPSRGVSGEYGYLNTETGEFRITLPNSKEEKLKEQLKLRKAALVTHSARQAKYERTDAKRRNHSDETVKKQVSVPIMTMNPDGTFTNNYVLLMAPNESSLSTHDPIAEFYIGAKALNPVFNLLGKGYTYGMARIGDNYARAKIISNELNKSLLNLNSPAMPLNIGWGPKQTFKVSHASNDGNMLTFFPKRWDVVNEGANPHGIWFQGKLGTPRTDFTNPGKGVKAARARALFANRPVLMQGNLTLEKPIITIGDVPSRSLLSYYADNAGADGLIYNGVYDNGYNNNQVILSFKKMNKTNDNKSPIKPSIGDITNRAEVRTLYPIYEKMKNSSHYREFSTPFFEENIGGLNITILGQLDAGKFSTYLAERIIENMKRLGFNPDLFNPNLWHDGMRVIGRPSTFIRTKAKEPINIYITKKPSNYIGFYNPTTGRAYARIAPNSNAESIRSTTIHEGVSHGTDDVVNTATNNAAARLYGKLTDEVLRAGFAREKGTENWYELRSTMAEFMRKMFNKHTRANPGATYADVQNAVYKEIDEMPANVMANGFGVINGYGYDYANYLRQNPIMLYKFRNLLKYGMGVLPVGYKNK